MEDLQIHQVLSCNPYDAEYDFRTVGLKDKHYDELLIQLQEYRNINKQLLQWTSVGEKHSELVLLSGYSGCGKSTFLNWFKKKNKSNKYAFEIINLISDPLKENDTNFIIEAVIDHLKNLVYNNQSINLILQNPEITYKLFKERNEQFSINQPWQVLKEVSGLIKNLSPTDKIGIIDIQERLNKNLTFKQILLIFLLEIILREKDQSGKSINVCFDNLDELEYEYLSEKIWGEFLNVRALLVKLCVLPSVGFPFNSRFSIILVFREANLLVNSAQNRDRRDPKLKFSKFLFKSTARKILNRRLEFCKKHLPVKSKNSKCFKIAKIVAKDSYTDRLFLPMYNYDYRRIIKAIVEISTEDLKYEANVVSPYWYDNVRKHSVLGGRATLASLFFLHLDSSGFLNELAPRPRDTEIAEFGYCRIPRVLLTIIYRHSYIDGVPKDIDLRNQKKPDKIKLQTIFETHFKYFKNINEFFYWIKSFFKISESSWAHLISIYGKQLNEGKLKFKKEQKLYEDKYIKKDENSYSKFQEINKDLYVHINASGYVYLRYIIIHFEYFSILNHKRINKKYTPLFLSYKRTPNKNDYQFTRILNDVFDETKLFKKNIEKFKQKTLNWDENDIIKYRDSYLCFKADSNSKGTYYLPRVVSFHVNYIDQFRYFILSTPNKFKPCSKYRSIGEVNEFMIRLIIKYCNLILQNKIIYSTIPRMNKIKTKAIKALGSDRNTWQLIHYDPKFKIKYYG